MPDANIVTAVANIQSSSPFHSVSEVEVLISANPDDREVYPQGSIRTGNGYDKTFSLSYVALSKLMNAAGIRESANQRIDDRKHPHICHWQFSAVWTQPDSTELRYSGDYELDLRDFIDVGEGRRVMAARFEKAFQDERQSVIKGKFSKDVESLKYDALTAKCDQLYAKLDDDGKREVDELAEAKALRYVVQMRQFIVQRAQTGAMERVIRKMLNLKSQYTAAELKLPFRVPRSRFDWDRLDKVLGTQESMQLRKAQAMQLLGLTANDLAQARQLEAPQWKQVVAEDGTPMAVADVHISGTVTESGDEIFAENIVKSEPVAETKAPVVVTPASPVTKDALAELEPKPDEVLFRGKIHKKSDKVGNAFSDKELKDWFQKEIVSKFEGPHYKNHLKDHFNVESAVNLTWDQLSWLTRYKINGEVYPVEYAGKEKKKPGRPKKVDTNIESIVEKIAVQIATELKVQDNAHASDIAQLITDVMGGIAGGTIESPVTNEGVKEIETFFREQLNGR